MGESGRKGSPRRIRITEQTCLALEKRMVELHRDHEDISPFVEWVVKKYLSEPLTREEQIGPARTVTVERIEHGSKRKTA